MTPQKTLRRSRSAGGPERLLLGAALLVPLGVVLFMLAQLPSTSLASAWSLTSADPSGVSISSQRPVSSSSAPPPTLVPPPATATPVPPEVAAAVATATPQEGGTYVVQPGDQLKDIAADNGVSIWKLIDANHIADPDSLQIGQKLRIPSG